MSDKIIARFFILVYFGTIIRMIYHTHAGWNHKTRALSILIFTSILLVSCSSSGSEDPTAFPTYYPFVPVDQNVTAPVPFEAATQIPTSTATRYPTPRRAPVSVTLMPTPGLDQPQINPTPDYPRVLPTARLEADQYQVQLGDTLGSIADRNGISMEALMQANSLTDPNLLSVGMILNIPAPDPGAAGPSFKIIPDSELVYGPASINFDVEEFLQGYNGYLSNYAEDVNGAYLTAAEIILRVAQNYSVNPRLLIALLEYQSGWLTNSVPYSVDYPLGLGDAYHVGLYKQLTWAADTLNRGYYLWRVNALSTWILADGTVVPIDPTINAGTAAVQNLFSKLDDRSTWESDVNAQGLAIAYYVLFGNPFNLAVEPLVPSTLKQPSMSLPFAKGEMWSFTGGPHGGWDSGSAWAALDFAPPGEAQGCVVSGAWVAAVADGLIVRTGDGAVIQDLDNDGYEETGWVVFYMHIESNERVQPETYIFAGDHIGHPSCEGGVSTGTHLHIARKYNGEWIPADGPLPFNLGGWVSSGSGIEYDGVLTRDGQVVEAWEGRNEVNQISH